MGNLLCKKNRGDSPISPVDRVIGRCAQICPQNLGKKKHFWDKQVLETSPPPLRHQPKLGSPVKETEQSGWETATLSVPDSPGNGILPPVAPPRKKRSSMSPKKDCSKKAEQSANLEQKEKSVDEKTPQKMTEKTSQASNTQTISSETVTEKSPSSPTQITSDIGNEKSDKFFGEHLSKTTPDETIPPAGTETEQVALSQSDKPAVSTDEVDNVRQPEQITVDTPDKNEKSEIEILELEDEMLRKINKETGNLIFALEKELSPKECPEYEGQTPVVEEIIVPVKRKPKHVCDDEDCLRKLLHHSPASDSVAPKKPQRDFTKYKKSLESAKSQDSCDSSQNQKSTKQKDDTTPTELDQNESLTEQNEPTKPRTEIPQDSIIETETISVNEIENTSPPPIPPKLKKRSDTPPANDVVSGKLERSKRKSESVPPNMPNSEKILRRCLSSQSYLTPELVEKIAQQANSLSLSAIYLPEDYSNSCNDGSGLVSPSYKLTEKRSLSSQVSRTSQSKSEDERGDNTGQQYEQIDKIAVEQTGVGNGPKLQTDETTKEETEDLSKTQCQVTAEINIPAATPLVLTTKESVIALESPISRNGEEQIERKLKKRVSVNSSSAEEISKTIQSLLEKTDLTPKTVLKILEDEFADVIHSKNLTAADKKAIEELRTLAEPITNSCSQSINSENSETTLKQHESDNETETVQNKTATLESNAKLTKSNHYSKIPKLKNKALDTVELSEKRRHSIDELESWFSPNSDTTEIKRRREASLPNCLDSPDAQTTQFFHPDPSDSLRNSTKQPPKDQNEHSSLLKFLEKERENHLS